MAHVLFPCTRLQTLAALAPPCGPSPPTSQWYVHGYALCTRFHHLEVNASQLTTPQPPCLPTIRYTHDAPRAAGHYQAAPRHYYFKASHPPALILLLTSRTSPPLLSTTPSCQTTHTRPTAPAPLRACSQPAGTAWRVWPPLPPPPCSETYPSACMRAQC